MVNCTVADGCPFTNSISKCRLLSLHFILAWDFRHLGGLHVRGSSRYPSNPPVIDMSTHAPNVHWMCYSPFFFSALQGHCVLFCYVLLCLPWISFMWFSCRIEYLLIRISIQSSQETNNPYNSMDFNYPGSAGLPPRYSLGHLPYLTAGHATVPPLWTFCYLVCCDQYFGLHRMQLCPSISLMVKETLDVALLVTGIRPWAQLLSLLAHILQLIVC